MLRTEFTDALLATGPSASIPEKYRIYDRLIGSWDVLVIDHEPQGARSETPGEWHFEYVLEGRAVQDVFIVPKRGPSPETKSDVKLRYGTTLRSFDAESGDWNVAWNNPISGARNYLIARANGENIVQLGTEPNGDLLRWCFVDIRERSARWTGERSSDGDATWTLEVEFFLSRRIVG